DGFSMPVRFTINGVAHQATVGTDWRPNCFPAKKHTAFVPNRNLYFNTNKTKVPASGIPKDVRCYQASSPF
ncbi:MAG TPA: hypothetical protein PK760_09515, partial [Flavobacteriales bacterium]|nr:hypothetical protein [Flavobacteriales bacterium]